MADDQLAPPYPLPEARSEWLRALPAWIVTFANAIRREKTWASLGLLADCLSEHYAGGTGLVNHLWLPHSREGCWAGECWALNHLLDRQQPVVAYHGEADWRDGDTGHPVINPGGWFGRNVLLFWVADRYDPAVWAVECDGYGDGEEIFMESGHGDGAVIDEAALPDYVDRATGEPGWNVRYIDGDGRPYDTEMVGCQDMDVAKVRYVGPGIPPEGVDPETYSYREECRLCGRDFFHGVCDPCAEAEAREDAENEHAVSHPG